MGGVQNRARIGIFIECQTHKYYRIDCAGSGVGVVYLCATADSTFLYGPRDRQVRHTLDIDAMSPSFVSFKGTRDGLSITLGEGEWRSVMSELAAQLNRQQVQSFFRGARVLLDTGNRPVDVMQLEELVALLAQHEMTLVSVMGEPHSQEAFAQVRAALAPPEIVVPDLTPIPPGGVPEIPTDGANAMLIHRTIRSGQKYRHAGTIVVIGDVNPGAELVADGDVIVWGKLRGVVHAGASGNEDAMVGALVLAPTQLRIGSRIARAPDERHAVHTSAEIARVRNGQIVVEPWNG